MIKLMWASDSVGTTAYVFCKFDSKIAAQMNATIARYPPVHTFCRGVLSMPLLQHKHKITKFIINKNNKKTLPFKTRIDDLVRQGNEDKYEQRVEYVKLLGLDCPSAAS